MFSGCYTVLYVSPPTHNTLKVNLFVAMNTTSHVMELKLKGIKEGVQQSSAEGHIPLGTEYLTLDISLNDKQQEKGWSLPSVFCREIRISVPSPSIPITTTNFPFKNYQPSASKFLS